MARIRSIHPGLFTDEAFMGLSAHARVLWMGLWCEADDQGMFPWKPLTLKARILPADNVDVGGLLDELIAAGCVKRGEVGGVEYGAVRNFTKFQRPKKPNPVHPINNEFRTFVGLTEQSGEAVPHQGGTGGEKPPQMEDGGGRREKETPSCGSPPPSRGARLPEDWQPSPSDEDFARQEGLSADDTRREAQKFRDYWHAKSGKDATKRDWPATWRNWVRRANESRAPPRHKPVDVNRLLEETDNATR